MTARDNLLHAWRMGREADPADTVETITTEAELEMYRVRLRDRGALTDAALFAIERRRHQLQKAKGVSWRS